MIAIQKMLEHGANPNQLGSFSKPLMIDASAVDFDFLKILFQFGADPNLESDNGTVFGQLVVTFRPKMSRAVFDLALQYGADVNLSLSNHDNLRYTPAQLMVMQEDNSEIVEALIQSRKIDWCKNLDPFFHHRIFDIASEHYKDLLAKYQITCGRFANYVGKGVSCELAKANVLKQCRSEGFSITTLEPKPSGEECYSLNASDGHREFDAFAHCTDD